MLLLKYYTSLFLQITGELALIALFLFSIAMQNVLNYFGA